MSEFDESRNGSHYAKKLSIEERNELYSLIPKLDELVKKYEGHVIFGGSRALNLFCKRSNNGFSFETDDIDVIIRSNVPSAFINNYNLRNETKDFDLFFPCGNIVVKLSNNQSEKLMLKAGDPEKEDFDKAIYGTLNMTITELGKIQFVFVNKTVGELEHWYRETSDLPVYIYYDIKEKEFVWMIKDPCGASLCLEGKLRYDQFHHDYRVEKYIKKGFTMV